MVGRVLAAAKVAATSATASRPTRAPGKLGHWKIKGIPTGPLPGDGRASPGQVAQLTDWGGRDEESGGAGSVNPRRRAAQSGRQLFIRNQLAVGGLQASEDVEGWRRPSTSTCPDRSRVVASIWTGKVRVSKRPLLTTRHRVPHDRHIGAVHRLGPVFRDRPKSRVRKQHPIHPLPHRF